MTSAPSMEVGQVIDDRYRILSLLGSGGMGAVYVAEQIKLNRNVALKMLRPEFADHELAARRFEREAHAVSTIDHPNVIRVLDFGEFGGQFYLVMELLEGRDFARLLREVGRLPWPRTQRFVRQLARGLAAVHASGIIHRDIKPGNCFLLDPKPGLESDRVKILDFGIAKMDADNSSATRLTQESQVVGTAIYMAPEQAQSGISDARSDVYALGVMTYELLTGQPPFRGDTPIQTVLHHVTTPPRPLREIVPELPPDVEAFVLGMLTKDPLARYQSMVEVEAALPSLANEAPDPTLNLTQVSVPTSLGPPVPLSAPTEILAAQYPTTTTDIVVDIESSGAGAITSTTDMVDGPHATPKRTRWLPLILAAGGFCVCAVVLLNSVVGETPDTAALADASVQSQSPPEPVLATEPAPLPSETPPASAVEPEPAPQPAVVAAPVETEPDAPDIEVPDIEAPSPADAKPKPKSSKPKSKSKSKATADKVEVTFIAGELKAVEIKIAGQTAMLEPIKTMRVPVGKHKVLYRKLSSEPWTEAGTIEIETDKSYRAKFRSPTGIVLTEKG